MGLVDKRILKNFVFFDSNGRKSGPGIVDELDLKPFLQAHFIRIILFVVIKSLVFN